MQKIVNRRTSEKSNLCIVFSAEEQEIYGLNEGDVVDIELVKIIPLVKFDNKKQKGGKI